jgi:hypothetical protein
MFGNCSRQALSIGADNLSNGMNLVALSAMISPVRPNIRLEDTTPTFPSWSSFPALHSIKEIDPVIWNMIRSVNGLRTRGPDFLVAAFGALAGVARSYPG